MIVKFRRGTPKIGLRAETDCTLDADRVHDHLSTVGGLTMLGHWVQTVLSDDETVFAWRRRRSERAQRRDRSRADAEVVRELRWQWRCVCSATSLSQIIYTPSGPTRGVPMIGHVDPGPPISFTVRMRPGQTLADFTAAAPSIAPAFDVTALRITPIGAHWLQITLVQAPLVAVPGRSLEPNVEAVRFGA
jgi:hypothetical protein